MAECSHVCPVHAQTFEGVKPRNVIFGVRVAYIEYIEYIYVRFVRKGHQVKVTGVKRSTKRN